MSEYKRLNKEIMGRYLGKKDMVFVAFYCKKATPYKNYSNMSEEDKQMNIPIVFMNSRGNDGKLGFVGGNVDLEDRNLREAVARESMEEVNYKLDTNKLVHFLTFVNDERHITSYMYELTEKEMFELYKNSINAEHFRSENCGSIMWQIHKYSYKNILKHKFSGTAKEELEEVIKILLPLSSKYKNGNNTNID